VHAEGRDGGGPDDAAFVVVLLYRGGGDAGDADAVASHDDGLFLAVLVEVGGAHRGRILRAKLEDVADLDHTFALECALALGARVAGAGFAEIREADAGGSALLDVGGADAAQVVVGLVGAGDVDAPAQDLVGDHGQRRGHGPDEAGLGTLRRDDLLGGGEAEVADEAAQLGLAELMVAAHADHDGVGVLPLRHDDERLDEGARRQAEEGADLVDGARPGGVDLARRRQLGRRRGGAALPRRLRGGVPFVLLRPCHRQLDVGRVAAGAAEDDDVLPRRARRHVLVTDRAAHHAGVAQHHHRLKAAAAHDAVIGLDVLLVAALQPPHVTVEAVGVLHDELACAQHAALGPRLVAFLRLEVVPELGQLLVAAHLARRDPGDDLLVGHRQGHVGALAVLEAEHLLADLLPAPRLLPELGGMHDRHEELLATDGVHLIADDGLDLAHDAPAGRQEDVDAGGELAHEAGAHHQLVADGLGAGRVFLHRG